VVKTRSSLLWDVMQLRLVVVTDISGKKNYRPHFQGVKNYRKIVIGLLKFGPTGFPETSITKYQSKPRKIPEGHRSDFVLELLCIF